MIDARSGRGQPGAQGGDEFRGGRVGLSEDDGGAPRTFDKRVGDPGEVVEPGVDQVSTRGDVDAVGRCTQDGVDGRQRGAAIIAGAGKPSEALEGLPIPEPWLWDR